MQVSSRWGNNTPYMVMYNRAMFIQRILVGAGIPSYKFLPPIRFDQTTTQNAMVNIIDLPYILYFIMMTKIEKLI